MVFFSVRDLTPKNGPKFKQVSPKTKKNNTKAEITQDWYQLRAGFFHTKLDHVKGASKKMGANVTSDFLIFDIWAL